MTQQNRNQIEGLKVEKLIRKLEKLLPRKNLEKHAKDFQ
jgi:hypothetical protein